MSIWYDPEFGNKTFDWLTDIIDQNRQNSERLGFEISYGFTKKKLLYCSVTKNEKQVYYETYAKSYMHVSYARLHTDIYKFLIRQQARKIVQEETGCLLENLNTPFGKETKRILRISEILKSYVLRTIIHENLKYWDSYEIQNKCPNLKVIYSRPILLSGIWVYMVTPFDLVEVDINDNMNKL